MKHENKQEKDIHVHKKAKKHSLAFTKLYLLNSIEHERNSLKRVSRFYMLTPYSTGNFLSQMKTDKKEK